MGTSTPWGVADDSERIAKGIMRYGTPGHGGYHLSPARQAEMPAALLIGGMPDIARGWYEEDCDWARIALAFPQFFNGLACAAAWETLRDWAPDAYEAFTGRKLQPGESYMRDKRR